MDDLAVKQACTFAKEHALKNGPIVSLFIRRAAHIKNGTSFHSLCTQQLNRSNFADVVHAISMKSVFSIYYNPRYVAAPIRCFIANIMGILLEIL
uniref:Dehydrogenase E1 component domain-containing protein n=1 Tax=Gossypium raimondii TaxID=29730 RepID=A0A0D2NNF5_GOSRA|nr:hypothetical protein B456_002G151200 [Gossypium raimondii]